MDTENGKRQREFPCQQLKNRFESARGPQIRLLLPTMQVLEKTAWGGTPCIASGLLEVLSLSGAFRE
jgi:hypothetical protein